MEKNMLELLTLEKTKKELLKIDKLNQTTSKFGLILSKKAANELIEYRNNTLKKHKRVEFREGILNKIIYNFSSSQYINQKNYLKSLKRLQEIFYEFKNESEDNLTDDEVIEFMKEQFEGVCFGDIDYLETACLENFTQAIRAGYRGYEDGIKGEYSKFDDVKRWDRDLYFEVLKEMLWR